MAKGKKNIKSRASRNTTAPFALSARTNQAPASRENSMRGRKPNPNTSTKGTPQRGDGDRISKKDIKEEKRYQRDKRKRIKKGRDYFFVMRKMTCFLLFIVFALCIGLFAVGYIQAAPEFTSLYVEPDYTPQEDRWIEDEETGEVIEKEDESKYFSTVDPLFGFIKKVTGKDLGPSPKYDAMAELVEVGVADMIAALAMQYYPIAMALFIIIALICMIKAFLAMFGRRIYRLFGLSSFWMIVFALVIVIAGIASNTPIDQNINFGEAVPFLMGALAKPVDGPTTAAGFGLLGMLILPIITLVLSMFAKKKIPYSIFD